MVAASSTAVRTPESSGCDTTENVCGRIASDVVEMIALVARRDTAHSSDLERPLSGLRRFPLWLPLFSSGLCSPKTFSRSDLLPQQTHKYLLLSHR